MLHITSFGENLELFDLRHNFCLQRFFCFFCWLDMASIGWLEPDSTFRLCQRLCCWNCEIFCFWRALYSKKCRCYCEVVNQADGLLVELLLSSCYDFVEQSCDSVLKNLLIMQKQRYGLLFAVTIADELFLAINCDPRFDDKPIL